ncbi:MAG: HAD family hydrolase [bacterium]
MHAVDLLIFDLDGTLVDTRMDLANAVNYARDALDLPSLAPDEVVSYVGDGLRTLVERSLPNERRDEVDQGIEHFQRYYRSHLLDNSRLYPGVREILAHFSGKKMTIVSNKPEEFTRSILIGLNVDRYFQMILGGDSLPVKKPAPEPILQTLARLESSSDKTVVVGDSTTDILAGKGAATYTCVVTYGFKNPDLLLAAEPDFVVDSILELRNIFV